MKILILEDNTLLRDALKKLLKTEGWNVTAASSYKEAHQLIEKQSFQVYLIDILLPDNKGYELLQHIMPNSKSKYILMSGFFNHSSILKYVPQNMKKFCKFLKKPIDEKELVKEIKETEKLLSESESESEQLYTKSFSLTFKCYLPEFKTFDTQELSLVLFLAYKFKFSGTLEITLNNKKKNLIKFNNGLISEVISDDKQSYFGALLVEHGLSLPEDIASIMKDLDTNEPMGEQLVNKALLSPHMLNVILKEQLKIRLTQIMSQLSFSVKILKEEADSSNATPFFNEQDFMEWIIDTLKTKIKDSFLESFYIKNKYNSIHFNSNVKHSLLNHQDFLNEYNNFFLKQIESKKTVRELLKNSKDSRKTLEFIYFGIIIRSIYVIDKKKEEISTKKSKELMLHILDDKTDNLFQILNVPWKASTEEVEKSYKNLIKVVHPDKAPHDASEETISRYTKAFEKIKDSYEILSDVTQRENYLKKREGESVLNILSNYEKGVNFIKSGAYKDGLDLLKAIEDQNEKPDNTMLYILWAKMKIESNIHNNKGKAGSFKKEIEKCPIDQRVSPLFWFVTGLYYKNVKQYEKAITLFKKTLQLQRNFSEASKEIVQTKVKMRAEKAKNKSKQSLLGFLNKKIG